MTLLKQQQCVGRAFTMHRSFVIRTRSWNPVSAPGLAASPAHRHADMPGSHVAMRPPTLPRGTHRCRTVTGGGATVTENHPVHPSNAAAPFPDPIPDRGGHVQYISALQRLKLRPQSRLLSQLAKALTRYGYQPQDPYTYSTIYNALYTLASAHLESFA